MRFPFSIAQNRFHRTEKDNGLSGNVCRQQGLIFHKLQADTGCRPPAGQNRCLYRLNSRVCLRNGTGLSSPDVPFHQDSRYISGNQRCSGFYGHVHSHSVSYRMTPGGVQSEHAGRELDGPHPGRRSCPVSCIFMSEKGRSLNEPG